MIPLPALSFAAVQRGLVSLVAESLGVFE